jgi:hypothetical protein
MGTSGGVVAPPLLFAAAFFLVDDIFLNIICRPSFFSLLFRCCSGADWANFCGMGCSGSQTAGIVIFILGLMHDRTVRGDFWNGYL